MSVLLTLQGSSAQKMLGKRSHSCAIGTAQDLVNPALLMA